MTSSQIALLLAVLAIGLTLPTIGKLMLVTGCVYFLLQYLNSPGTLLEVS